MPRPRKPARDVPLVPPSEFEEAVKRILSTPKVSVEQQMEKLHASNRQRRNERSSKPPAD